MLKNITQYEIPLLHEDFNLTDGHVYRDWSPEERKIIEKTSEFMQGVDRQIQADLEQEYVSVFLTYAKQTIDFEAHKYLLCHSASMGADIIAKYLSSNNLSVSLIEPCFDNIADIFKRLHVHLEPFPDVCLEQSSFVNFLEEVNSDAICLVSPNNPTGRILIKDNFLALVNYCRKNKKLLILDCCFRAYLPEEFIFDQYGILRQSGIDYILVEDTGKTWPASELKVPFLTVSASLYKCLYDIYTDLILHVSPFAVKLLTELIKSSSREGILYSQEVVNINRELLYKNVAGTILSPVERPFTSVSWLKVYGMTAFQLKQILDDKGIHILPGDFFYWSNHELGKQFIRISLSRDLRVFERAAALLGNICHELTEIVRSEK